MSSRTSPTLSRKSLQNGRLLAEIAEFAACESVEKQCEFFEKLRDTALLLFLLTDVLQYDRDFDDVIGRVNKNNIDLFRSAAATNRWSLTRAMAAADPNDGTREAMFNYVPADDRRNGRHEHLNNESSASEYLGIGTIKAEWVSAHAEIPGFISAVVESGDPAAIAAAVDFCGPAEAVRIIDTWPNTLATQKRAAVRWADVPGFVEAVGKLHNVPNEVTRSIANATTNAEVAVKLWHQKYSYCHDILAARFADDEAIQALCLGYRGVTTSLLRNTTSRAVQMEMKKRFTSSNTQFLNADAAIALITLFPNDRALARTIVEKAQNEGGNGHVLHYLAKQTTTDSILLTIAKSKSGVLEERTRTLLKEKGSPKVVAAVEAAEDAMYERQGRLNPRHVDQTTDTALLVQATFGYDKSVRAPARERLASLSQSLGL